MDQTPEIGRAWAEQVGPFTSRFVQSAYNVEKQALQAVFALKKQERNYTKYEIERACKIAFSMTERPTVKIIQTLLKNNQKEDAEQALKVAKNKTDSHYGFRHRTE